MEAKRGKEMGEGLEKGKPEEINGRVSLNFEFWEGV